MKSVKVKIKLKQRHPAGMMYHGRHVIEPYFKTLDFNAQELKDLDGAGPKHWFEFSIVKRLKVDEKKELQAMREKIAQDAADQKREMENKKKADMEAEDQMLKELTQKQLIKQGV